jgi:tRNA (guanosine-2'-O-)-methyltransferase
VQTDRRLGRIRRVLHYRQPDLTVVMENIHDPHNVSAMLRSCDAAGVMEVQLVYTEEEFPDIGKKSSASAKKWVQRRKFQTIQECCSSLRSEGFRIYATRLAPNARSLYDLDLTQPSAFVFGNEHRGVSEEAATGADASIQIPMMGMIESLNVSVACAVMLFEAVRQRIAAGHYETSKMKEAQLAKLTKEWAIKK